MTQLFLCSYTDLQQNKKPVPGQQLTWTGQDTTFTFALSRKLEKRHWPINPKIHHSYNRPTSSTAWTSNTLSHWLIRGACLYLLITPVSCP